MKKFAFMIYSENNRNNTTVNLPIGYISTFNNEFKYFICENVNDWPNKEFVLIETDDRNNYKIFHPEIKKFISFKKDILLTSDNCNSSIFNFNKKESSEFLYLYCNNNQEYVYINYNNELNTKKDGNIILLKKKLLY